MDGLVGALKAFWRGNRGTIVVVAILVVGYMALRMAPSDIATASALEDRLSGGETSVVVFYSNF